MISVRLHPAARREIRRAFEWYLQEAGPRIATGFLDDFEHTLALLKNHPEIGEPGTSNTRCLIFQRYHHLHRGLSVERRLAGNRRHRPPQPAPGMLGGPAVAAVITPA